jgi:membrane protein
MELWEVLKRTLDSWSRHNAFRLSAAMAFYALLSLAPLLVLLITAAAWVFGHTSAQQRITNEMQNTVGSPGAAAVREMMKSPPAPATGTLATAVGLVTLLFGASGVFSELRDSLNTVWEVTPEAGGGITGFLRKRVVIFGMVLAVGFLLLVSLVISTVLAAVGRYFADVLPAPEFLFHVVSDVISVAGIAILFALIFKYVPEIQIGWKDVWAGAVATSFLFTVGKVLIGLYLGKAAVGSAYGAAGSMIAVTVWVYYSSLIFFFGAEFTHELACRRKGFAQQRRT